MYVFKFKRNPDFQHLKEFFNLDISTTNISNGWKYDIDSQEMVCGLFLSEEISTEYNKHGEEFSYAIEGPKLESDLKEIIKKLSLETYYEELLFLAIHIYCQQILFANKIIESNNAHQTHSELASLFNFLHSLNTFEDVSIFITGVKNNIAHKVSIKHETTLKLIVESLNTSLSSDILSEFATKILYRGNPENEESFDLKEYLSGLPIDTILRLRPYLQKIMGIEDKSSPLSLKQKHYYYELLLSLRLINKAKKPTKTIDTIFDNFLNKKFHNNCWVPKK